MRETDLKYFEELLLDRQVQIKKNIADVSKELDGLRDVEINDEGDYVSLSIDDLRDNAISTQQKAELTEIQSAIKKIKDGTYGICEMCEEPIKIHRLKVKPHAKYCIICREIHEKNPM